MHAFLINLDSATARLEAATLSLKKVNCSFERVSAIRGAALTALEKNSLYSSQLNKQRYFQPMSDGEIGCYASHIHVWKLAHSKGLPYCLVLEDDLSVSDQLPAALGAIEQLPVGWDIIRLNTRANEAADARTPLLPGVDLIRFKRVPSRTTGYVISAAAIKKLLSLNSPFYRPIDIDMRYFWEFKLDMLGVSPALVTESELSLQSTIDRPAKKSGALKTIGYRWAKLIEQAKYTVANQRARSTSFPWQKTN
jgi:glycosyl transferase, family 25